MDYGALLSFHTHLRKKAYTFSSVNYIYISPCAKSSTPDLWLTHSHKLNRDGSHQHSHKISTLHKHCRNLHSTNGTHPSRTVLDHCSKMRLKDNWLLKNKSLKQEIKHSLVLFLSNAKSKDISWRTYPNPTCIHLLKSPCNLISVAFTCYHTQLPCSLNLLPPAKGRRLKFQYRLGG